MAAFYNKQALNWLLAILNDNTEDGLLPKGQKLLPATLDKEMSVAMLTKIITFIINHIFDEIQLPPIDSQSCTRRLKKLEEVGLTQSPVFLDANLDRLYQNLKSLYPEGVDSLNFKIFIKPKPNEVKETLSYLAQLWSFFFDTKDGFWQISDDMEEASIELNEVYNDLEAVKENLNLRYSKIGEWKNNIPFLEEELKDVTFSLDTVLLEEQELQERLKACIQENQNEENFIKDLEKKLQSWENELNSHKAQIVDSPETISQDLVYEKQRLETIKRKRDEIGKSITEIGKDEVDHSEAVHEAGGVIDLLKDVVQEMGVLLDDTQDFSKLSQCKTKMGDQIMSLDNNIMRSRSQKELIKADAIAAIEDKKKEMKLKNSLKDKIGKDIRAMQQIKYHGKENIEGLKCQIEKLRTGIILATEFAEAYMLI